MNGALPSCWSVLQQKKEAEFYRALQPVNVITESQIFDELNENCRKQTINKGEHRSKTHSPTFIENVHENNKKCNGLIEPVHERQWKVQASVHAP